MQNYLDRKQQEYEYESERTQPPRALPIFSLAENPIKDAVVLVMNTCCSNAVIHNLL